MYRFSDTEKRELQTAIDSTPDAKTRRRLLALQMRAEGKRNREISADVGFHTQYVTVLVSRYKADGLRGVSGNPFSSR